jgi:uncharacterized membrane protein
MRRRTRHPVALGLVVFLLSPFIGGALLIWLLIRICYEALLVVDYLARSARLRRELNRRNA